LIIISQTRKRKREEGKKLHQKEIALFKNDKKKERVKKRRGIPIKLPQKKGGASRKL